MINVLIVDDERMVQDLFTFYLTNADKDYTVVEKLKSASNALLFCEHNAVDLILMDVCTDENESGLIAAAEIKKRFPNIKIIIVTSAPEHSFIARAKEAGADSFWYKEISSVGLLEVIERTLAGESIYPDSTPTLTLGLCSSDEFTPKELEVLRYLVEGNSIGEIADKMFVDYGTTKTHIRHLKEKTGAKNITDLAIMAVKSRLIIPEY